MSIKRIVYRLNQAILRIKFFRTKFLTVPSSNSGRSLGDVFLALFSSKFLVQGHRKSIFLSHPNHKEIISYFSSQLNGAILSDNPKEFDQYTPIDIHSFAGGHEHLNTQINNPWRYFIINKTKPFDVAINVTETNPKITGKCILIFPERSDNLTIPPHLLATFVDDAKSIGYTVYENTYINSNYKDRQRIPNAIPINHLSISEIIAIAKQPNVIILGTRAGIFDVLYFTTTGLQSKLVVLYPRSPEWIWDARFCNSYIEENFKEFYYDRGNVYEVAETDFIPNYYTQILQG